MLSGLARRQWSRTNKVIIIIIIFVKDKIYGAARMIYVRTTVMCQRNDFHSERYHQFFVDIRYKYAEWNEIAIPIWDQRVKSSNMIILWCDDSIVVLCLLLEISSPRNMHDMLTT